MQQRKQESAKKKKKKKKKKKLLNTVAENEKPRGYKTFFVPSSAEHEIFSANKYENADKSWHFHIY